MVLCVIPQNLSTVVCCTTVCYTISYHVNLNCKYTVLWAVSDRVKDQVHTIFIRDLIKSDEQAFLHDLCTSDLASLPQIENADEALECFLSVFGTLSDKH